MTWGQLRFQLLQTTPGLNIGLLDEWLNGRYEQVLEATDWTGIHARATLQTVAAYQSGTDTATLTLGSALVAGVGTSWTSDLVGSGFYRQGDTPLYTIIQYSSGVSITLDRPYEGNGVDAVGTVYAGSAYVFAHNLYTLPDDCRAVETIINPISGYPLTRLTAAELDETAGARTLIGEPTVWAAIEDAPESWLNPVHQVELYPPPRLARGYTVEYLRAAYQFNGTNLTQSPLPFVSQSVLLYGARADIAAWQGKMAQAAGYEAKFQEELRRLILVEHAERKTKPSLRMDTRYTRHRMARVTRGSNRTWGPGAGGPG